MLSGKSVESSAQSYNSWQGRPGSKFLLPNPVTPYEYSTTIFRILFILLNKILSHVIKVGNGGNSKLYFTHIS